MKKRLLSMVLTICILTSALIIMPTTINAKETFVESVGETSGTTGDCTWSYDENTGTLTISGNGEMEDYFFSSDVPWYSYRKSIKTVKINSGVTSIGGSAFECCTSLTSITIGDSVTSISDCAFSRCRNLTGITIPDSVTSIGDAAFYCTSLTSITIPDSVTSIGKGAFGCCESLTSITIPDSVTSIGEGAFGCCTSLTSITIPDSVTSIGGSAFGDCTSLTSINVDSSNKYYSSIDGNLYNKDKTELIQYAIGKTAKSFTIPDSVTSIDDGAFRYCTSLTCITIGNSVTIIGDSAFYNCTSLKDVYYTGTSSQWNNISIDSHNEPLKNATIHYNYVPTFSGTTGVCTWSYDSSTYTLTISGNGAMGEYDSSDVPWYSYGGSIKTVKINSGVTSVGSSAFKDCASLTSITIPDSVTWIGEEAFYNTAYYNDKSNWDNSVLYIGKCLLDADSEKLSGDYVIKDGTKIIASYAFYSCTSLTSITIPDSATSIGDNAFEYCTSLTSITIPDSVTSIGDNAFEDCTSLKSVKIGNSVTSIGGYAFEDCTSLTSITIPDSVTSIGDNAFEDCTRLKSVKIGNSVTSIGNSAFEYCTSLTSITIPDSVTSIGWRTFSGCTNLKSVTIGKRVKSIDSYAFEKCKTLKSVYIGKNVKGIGESAFSECIRLTDIYYSGSKEQWKKILIYDGNERLAYAEKHYNYFTTISLKKSSVSIYVKGSVTIKPTVKNGKGATTYKSNNTKVAKVDSKGKVTALKAGTARITVTNNKVSRVFTVKVMNPKLNKNSVTLKKGKAFTLKITGKIGTAKFTTSNKKIATVNSKGKIVVNKKAKKNQIATITVKSNGVTLKCKVKVK